MQAVVATVKKTGNVTVSYKKQGTVNKQTFVVKKYTNPLKSLKIDGTNIASKFKTDNVYVLPYAKYAGKKIKVSYSAASNFELSYVDYLLQPGNMKSDMDKMLGSSRSNTYGPSTIPVASIPIIRGSFSFWQMAPIASPTRKINDSDVNIVLIAPSVLFSSFPHKKS
jgi:hypothetical protein